MTPLRPTTLCLALASLALHTGTQAESNPYYLGASLGLTQVSNVYRTPTGQPSNSDWVATGRLLAGLDQRLGRQRLFADASVNTNRYRNNSGLNNVGYGFNGGLEWSTIGDLSGVIQVGANESLAQFNPGDKPYITKKNVETGRQANATVRYGGYGKLVLELTGGYATTAYSAEEYRPYEYKQTSMSGGARYRFSPKLTVGAALRKSNGSYDKWQALPGGGFRADKIDRKTVDLTATYTPSEISQLSARASVGKAKHSEARNSDFSGVTGSVNWRYLVGAKLKLNTSFTRDTGLDSSTLNLGPFGSQISDYNRVSNSLALNADYALTGKVSLTAGVNVTQRDITNGSSGVLGNQTVNGSDRSTGLRLGASWAATRNSVLSCQVTRDQRSVTSGSSTLLLPYTANSVGCYAQIMVN